MSFIPSNHPITKFHTTFGLPATVLCILSLALATPPSAFGQDVWHVDDDAPLGGDGATWATALRYLQDALVVAEDDDQIRVAQGLYKPDQDEFGNVTPGDREVSFELVSGVGLYGGYAGLGAPNPDERDVTQYETILSGDLNGNDGSNFANYGENSYHVVFGEFLDNDTVLDGFTLTAGNADGALSATNGGALYLSPGSLRIVRCTFNNCLAQFGGAIYSESSTTIVECAFSGNKASSGGGGAIIPFFTSTTLVDCSFDDNQATGIGEHNYGGAIDVFGGSLYASGTRFSGNFAVRGGGAVVCFQAVAEFVNCEFSGNNASQGGAIYVSGLAHTVTNSTFWGNMALQECGGLYVRNADATISNCVFWQNSDAGGMNEGAQIATEMDGITAVAYSCIQNYAGSYGTDGVITANPLLVDPDGGDNNPGTADDDLRLSPGSPCIDAADNNAVPWDFQDLDGDGVIFERIPFDVAGAPRFVDDPNTPDTGLGTPPIVDMGAHESQQQGLVVSASEVVVPEGGTATFTVHLAMAPDEPITVLIGPIAGDPDISVQSGHMLAFDADNFDLPQPVTLAAALDADDINGETTIGIWTPGLALVHVTASEADLDASAVAILVNAAAPTGGDGASWTTAFNDLQDALDAADNLAEPVEIWVAAGTYTPDRGTGDTEVSFELRDDVAVLGGFVGDEDSAELRDPAANETILSGDLGGGPSSNSIVDASYTDASAVLDGFTISGGDGSDGAGLYLETGSPTILRCTFMDNHASSGGALAIYWYGSPIFVGCAFVNNSASVSNYSGGAVAMLSANAVFVDCLFADNQADSGGAIYALEGALLLANCKFLGNNAAAQGASVRSNAADVFAMNCIFSGQQTAEDGAAFFDGAWVNLVNCDFSHNAGRGIVARGYSDVFAYNSVFWGNTYDGQSGQDAQIRLDGDDAQLDIRYSCVQGWTGGFGGIGNHGENPLFVDANGPDDLFGTEDDDLHLSPGSPCIDSGSNYFVLDDFADLDGDGDFDEYTPLDLDRDGRFVDDPNTPDGGGGVIAIVDMGAYEFGEGGEPYILGDLNGDGEVTIDDIAVLLAHFGTPSGALPFEGDMDADGDVDLADLALILSIFGESGG